MGHLTMDQAIGKLREENPKYAPAAYHFIRRALDHSLRKLKREEMDRPAHVSGKELLEGFRDLALEEYGPLAKTVLEDWGITRCAEVGEIVFQLVRMGVLGKNDNDVIEDFEEQWTLSEVFDVPFQPQTMEAPKKARSRNSSPARSKTAGNRSSQPVSPTEFD